MIKQKVIKREFKTVNTGEMGFNDYETIYEDYDHFIDRVTEFINNVNFISVSYPDKKTAIVVYDTRSAEEATIELTSKTLDLCKEKNIFYEMSQMQGGYTKTDEAIEKIIENSSNKDFGLQQIK